MKIVLCGYMGCGKTLIGRSLAQNLALPFLDLDEEITKGSAHSISVFFVKNGEIAFRKTEASVLKSCLQKPMDGVLALGGGTPCYGHNLKLIKAADSVLVYLKMAPQSLAERLFDERKSRPLIQNTANKEELMDFIRKHLFERQYYYMQSDIIMDCSIDPPETLVRKLVGKLRPFL